MALKVSAADGVKIYNLSSGKSLPEWVGEKRRKERTSVGEQRVELLQDFRFPSACRKIQATTSGDCIVATGNYPPQVRLFDVANLSSKVTRHFDAEIADFEILTEDFSKLAFLCSDRTVKFHARFGYYHETRIPLCGRVIRYVPFTAHLLIAGSCSELHRLDLSEGKFLEPIPSLLESINACDLSSAHGLICCAGSDGFLECMDVRQPSSVGSLDVASALQKEGSELTAVKFESLGLQLAVGTSDGTVALFDLRSHKPLVVKEHMYDSPIHSLHYLNPDKKAHSGQANKIASADSFVVKIWDSVTAETYTNVEPGKNAGINHVHWWEDSGLFFVACDDSKIQSYFIPSLGTAPSWCSFLEGMTEELEEEAGHVLYDDYRFVTQEELMDVGLSHLIGTDLLKAYMHGHFIHHKLYTKAQLMHKPHPVIPFRLSESRISAERKVPEAKKQSQEKKTGIQDERFRAIYDDPAFQIDASRQPHDTDSLLVPSDSVMPTTTQNRPRAVLGEVEEATLPFEARTAKQGKQGKKNRTSGEIQFQFTPQSRQPSKGKKHSSHRKR